MYYKYPSKYHIYIFDYRVKFQRYIKIVKLINVHTIFRVLNLIKKKT